MLKNTTTLFSVIVLSLSIWFSFSFKEGEEDSFSILSKDVECIPTSTTGQIVIHSNYSLSYSERHEQAEWVAYKLTKENVYAKRTRTNDFRADPKIKTGSAKLADYKRSGFDRGHLAPAADMKKSHVAMSESFYLSNMSPQTASFNRGIWRTLESQVRSWAISENEIYVITGPVLQGEFHLKNLSRWKIN